MSGRSVVVVPARFGSTRFPGKVLARLAGKPIIQWVYEKAIASRADEVLIATDDERVADAAASFGAKVVMTSAAHVSGTDRAHEAIAGIKADIIINAQGDEPFLPPPMIDRLIGVLEGKAAPDMATVAVRAARGEVAANPNAVKVVFDQSGRALYFSRAPIPFLREGGDDTPMYKHWGIYGFRRPALECFVSLPPGKFENCEKLEQLRALENGIAIQVLVSDTDTIGIDTPEDLAAAEKFLANADSGMKIRSVM